jgi:hypothetical protein
MVLTPYHNDRQEDARPKLLEKDVRQGLEARVRHEEDGKRRIVLAVGHLQIFLQAVNLRIADVGPIQEGDQIQERQPWYELDV